MFSSAPSAPVIDLLYLFTGVPLAHSQPPCAPVVDLLPVTYFSFSPAYHPFPRFRFCFYYQNNGGSCLMFSSAPCAPVVDLLPVTYLTFSPAYRSLPYAPVVDLFSVTFELGDL